MLLAFMYSGMAVSLNCRAGGLGRHPLTRAATVCWAAVLWCSASMAAPISVRYREGLVHGFLTVRTLDGALIANVAPNSPAARAGLKPSDLIIAIEGQSIDDPNAFDYRFATRQLGGAAQIDVQRAGKTVKLTVPLETAPDTNRDEIVLTARSPFQGAKVANISPAVADELHLDSQTEGVVVIDLADDGTAASVGFQKGDIILAVNNQKIARTSDLDKASKTSSRLWRIVVVRGGQQINVTLGG